MSPVTEGDIVSGEKQGGAGDQTHRTSSAIQRTPSMGTAWARRTTRTGTRLAPVGAGDGGLVARL